MTRRTLLGVGVMGALALGVGGLGLSLQPSAPAEPPGPLVAVGPLEYGVLVAVAEVLLPAEGLTVDARQVAARVDHTLATFHPTDAAEVGQVLRLLENGLAGLLLDGRPTPFTRASLETRRRALERWRTSRLHLRRTAYRAVVGLVYAAFWSDPATYAFAGYAGPPAWAVHAR